MWINAFNDIFQPIPSTWRIISAPQVIWASPQPQPHLHASRPSPEACWETKRSQGALLLSSRYISCSCLVSALTYVCYDCSLVVNLLQWPRVIQVCLGMARKMCSSCPLAVTWVLLNKTCFLSMLSHSLSLSHSFSVHQSWSATSLSGLLRQLFKSAQICSDYGPWRWWYLFFSVRMKLSKVISALSLHFVTV